jgi:lysophospholipase L1-like esterase
MESSSPDPAPQPENKNSEGPSGPVPQDSSPIKRISARRKAGYLLVVWCVFILGMLLVEIGFRTFAEPVDLLDAMVRDHHQSMFGGIEGEQVFEADPLLAWKLKPSLDHVFWDYTNFSTDPDGLRTWGRPSPDGKQRKTLRIVCLGDSVTFGYRVPVAFPKNPRRFNPDSKPYPQRLEEMLRDELPDRDVRVIVMAVPGYSTHQCVAWVKRRLGRYQPDIVCICFGWNDTDLRDLPDHVTMPMHFRARFQRQLKQGSHVFRNLSFRWAGKRKESMDHSWNTAAEQVPRVSREDYVRNILEMAAEVDVWGARLLVIAPVYRDRISSPEHARRMGEYRKALVEMTGVHSIPCLLIPELTEESADTNKGLFGEVIHPNERGHMLMARRVHRDIISQGWLD